MLTALLSFFKSNISPIIYITLALIAISGIGFGYYEWRQSITNAANTKFDNDQLQQTIKDLQKHIVEMQTINTDQSKQISDLQAQNQKVVNDLKTVYVYLDSPDAKKSDRISSDILVKTIKMLSK